MAGSPSCKRALSAFRETHRLRREQTGPQLIQHQVPARRRRFFECRWTPRVRCRRAVPVPSLTRPGWWPAFQLVPTLLQSIPFTVLVAFTPPQHAPAADGPAPNGVRTTVLGPVVTVPVAGAGATAICADSALAPSEEIDAMRVLASTHLNGSWSQGAGASTLVALLLNGLRAPLAWSGGACSVSGRQPAFINGLTVLTRTARIDTRRRSRRYCS